MISFTLEGYVLAMINGGLQEQSKSQVGTEHPDFYKLKRCFQQQLRVEHPYLFMATGLGQLYRQLSGLISAMSSGALAESDSPTPEQG